MSPRTTTQPLTCDKCRTSFQHQRGLDKHLEAWRYRFRCQECHMSCADQADMRQHHFESHRGVIFRTAPLPPSSRTSPADQVTVFPCDKCTTSFQHQHGLDKHLEAWRYRFRCQECHMTCADQADMRQHHFESHRGVIFRTAPLPPSSRTSPAHQVIVFPCTTCGHSFKDQHGLQTHRDIKLHMLQLPCRDCPSLFDTWPALDLHRDTAHANQAVTDRSLFPCTACTRSFKTQPGLGQHYADVHATYYCHTCGAQCVTEQFLVQHCATTHPTPVAQRESPMLPPRSFPCAICNSQFPSQYSLDEHHTLHDPISTSYPQARVRARPQHQFKCPLCHKIFASQYALDQHMVSAAHPEYVQTGRRPLLKCDECESVFEVKDLLTLHAADHVAERLKRRN